MRTIKFRGKTKSGEWVYGPLVMSAVYPPYICWADEASVVIDAPVIMQDSIGQYTGLKDSDGKEIYEGDILRLGNSDSGVCEVGWSESVSAYCIRFHFESEFGLKPLGSWKECERNMVVIGNIHDNPELLKGCKSDRD